MASIERLYELCNIITDAKDKAAEHEKEFKEILKGVNAGPNEKRLTSQFVARFYKLFPNLQEDALNALFDLCEDTNVSVRKQVLKDLPTLCKEKNDIIAKVSDILAQLLQVEDPSEVTAVENALLAIYKMSALGTLTGLFYQIENSTEELVREKSIRFILSKVKSLGSEYFPADVEEYIQTEAKKVLKNAAEEEFVLLIELLRNLKVMKSVKGYQQLVDIVSEECDPSSDFSNDAESAQRAVSVVRSAAPFFSSSISSTKFVEYLCKAVLPCVVKMDEKTRSSSTLALETFKVLAEIINHCSVLDDLEEKLKTVYDLLLEVMPLPPADATAESLESGAEDFEFSRVECLLYIFHKMGKNMPEFLNDDADRLKDFRSRLQYFARVCQAYSQKLKEAVKDKKGEELKTEENKMRFIALKTTTNINSLIKDLFHQPPSYKQTITLSWIENEKGSIKRPIPIIYNTSPNKKQRTEKRIYNAPKRGRGGRGFNRRGGFRKRF